MATAELVIPYTATRPRIDLAEAIPLSAPFAMFVEPTNICNFRCGFCPESFPDFQERAGYYQRMSWHTWQRIYASLRNWPPLKVIRFYHEGEPLLNPQLPAMIAQGADVCERTELTTNGSLLGKYAQALVDAGLDYLRVSVYAARDEEYRNITKSGAGCDIPANLGLLRALRGDSEKPFIFAQLVTPNPSRDVVQLFHSRYSRVADEISVLDGMHNWGGSDNRLVELGQKERPEKQVCPQPFYQLAIKANGKVSVCCADWDNKLVVGDVNQETLQDIWAGPRLRELQQLHLSRQRRRLPGCRDCTVLHKHPDNLDSHGLTLESTDLPPLNGRSYALPSSPPQ